MSIITCDAFLELCSLCEKLAKHGDTMIENPETGKCLCLDCLNRSLERMKKIEKYDR